MVRPTGRIGARISDHRVVLALPVGDSTEPGSRGDGAGRGDRTGATSRSKSLPELASHGITPGTRIALIGPHAESYWARTARLHIVASVPRNRVSEFWKLSPAAQDSLLDAFAAAGATYAIATVGVPGVPPDSTWEAVKYHGEIKKLRC